MPEILHVEQLKTYFETPEGTVPAVDGVTFSLHQGKTLALVGESGCGKSVTALSILRLIPSPGEIIRGRILLDDRNLLELPESQMRKIRGGRISMIFQEPMTSLNPVFTVGDQIAEAIQIHEKLTKKELRERIVDALTAVGIPAPQTRLHDYPHQLSGGMRQRVMIAMAVACSPSVLIADEPTTALDVTIQAQILDLMRQLQEEMGMSILLITHDLGVVAELADDVAVMYAGQIVENAPVKEIFQNPRHPYTQGLLRSIPSITGEQDSLVPIRGSIPEPGTWGIGCRFAPRCDLAVEVCRAAPVALERVNDAHQARCVVNVGGDPQA